jgi:uncharacterized membrane protein
VPAFAVDIMSASARTTSIIQAALLALTLLLLIIAVASSSWMHVSVPGGLPPKMDIGLWTEGTIMCNPNSTYIFSGVKFDLKAIGYAGVWTIVDVFVAFAFALSCVVMLKDPNVPHPGWRSRRSVVLIASVIGLISAIATLIWFISAGLFISLGTCSGDATSGWGMTVQIIACVTLFCANVASCVACCCVQDENVTVVNYVNAPRYAALPDNYSQPVGQVAVPVYQQGYSQQYGYAHGQQQAYQPQAYQPQGYQPPNSTTM